MSKTSVALEPFADYIVVHRDEAKEKSEGGIIIPDNAKERQHRGTVVAVGPGRYTESGTLIPMRVKDGDRVLFPAYTGTEIDLEEGHTLVFIKEEQLLARYRIELAND